VGRRVRAREAGKWGLVVQGRAVGIREVLPGRQDLRGEGERDIS